MRAKYWNDFGSLSVTGMFKRADAASEEGGMPSENEAEMLCPQCLLIEDEKQQNGDAGP